MNLNPLNWLRGSKFRNSGGTIALLPLAELGIPRLSAFDKPKAWSF